MGLGLDWSALVQVSSADLHQLFAVYHFLDFPRRQRPSRQEEDVKFYVLFYRDDGFGSKWVQFDIPTVRTLDEADDFAIETKVGWNLLHPKKKSWYSDVAPGGRP